MLVTNGIDCVFLGVRVEFMSEEKTVTQMVTEWCRKHLATIITILTIIAGVIGVVFSLDGGDLDLSAFHSTLLIIIAVNLLAIIHGYMEKHTTQIKYLDKKLSNLLENSPSAVGNKVCITKDYPSNMEWDTIITNATHDVFLSTITLSRLRLGGIHRIEAIDNEKRIRLLSTNPENDELYTALCKMRHLNTYEETKERYNSQFGTINYRLKGLLSSNDNVILRRASRIIPCDFIAVDCGIDGDINDKFTPNSNSVIYAHFYIPDKEVLTGVMSVTAIYGTDLFDELKNFIETVWKEALDA